MRTDPPPLPPPIPFFARWKKKKAEPLLYSAG